MAENTFDTALHTWMTAVQIQTWQQLSTRTGISRKRLQKIRRGHLDHLHLSELYQLSQVLQIPLSQFLAQFDSPSNVQTPTAADPQTFQAAALQTLESFMIYWPAAAYQAQQDPEFPARKLLPLVKPIERLLASWDVQPLAAVGTTVSFNPHHHQALEGQIAPGEMVTVRYPGYQQGEKLLFRSQVSRQ